MSFAEIKVSSGYPEIFIDNKRVAPLIYTLTKNANDEETLKLISTEGIINFAKAGINLISVISYAYLDWNEDGTYNAESVIKTIKFVLSVNPDAKILVRFNLTPPYWWLKKYPDERIKYYGVADTIYQGDAKGYACGDNTTDARASFVSRKWRDDIKWIIGRLAEVLTNEGIIDSVVGIQPAYGTCGEWHMYGKYCAREGGYEGDYSKPMLGFFREYVKNKYKTVKNLQKAWGEDVTFETCQLAPPQMRQDYKVDGDCEYLLPEYSMRALDTLKCFQLGASTAISEFCAEIKKDFGRGVLAGSFYGYYFGAGNVYSRTIETDPLLKDKNVDFFAAPCPYTRNKKPGNVPFLRYVSESYRLNGKLFICEMDQGYSSKCVYRDEPTNTYTCNSVEEYNNLLVRNSMFNLLRGMGVWFFDWKWPVNSVKLSGYWNDKGMMDGIIKVKEFCDKMHALRPNYTQTADVLFVYDTESIYYLGLGEMHNTYNQLDMENAISKTGVGYNFVYLNDIQKVNINEYKCVVFVDCVYMTSSNYRYIKEVVMGGNRVVTFMGRNGYIVDNITSLSNIADLTETSLPENNYIEKRKNYTLVTVSGLVYNTEFYKKIFEIAGAHFYTSENEIVCANDNFVFVHSTGEYDRKVNLNSGELVNRVGVCDSSVYDNLTGIKVL